MESKNNKIEKFNNEAKSIMKGIAELSHEKKLLDKKDKELRTNLVEIFEKYNVDFIDNEFLKISKTKGYESTSVDVSKIKKEHLDLYDELIKRFPKIRKVNSSIRITVKDGE